MIETRTHDAILGFALVAQIHNRLHMFIAEQEKAEIFWNSMLKSIDGKSKLKSPMWHLEPILDQNAKNF